MELCHFEVFNPIDFMLFGESMSGVVAFRGLNFRVPGRWRLGFCCKVCGGSKSY